MLAYHAVISVIVFIGSDSQKLESGYFSVQVVDWGHHSFQDIVNVRQYFESRACRYQIRDDQRGEIDFADKSLTSVCRKGQGRDGQKRTSGSWEA